MQTYTYLPFVGAVATTDPNNNVTYYSYDALGRLTLITDFNGNVLKAFAYHYQQQ
jgi:YD repeat-containing protein